MRKLLFLLLSTAVAVSASAGITKSALQQKVVKMSDTKSVEQLVRKAAPGTVSTPYTAVLRATPVDVPEGYAQVKLTAGNVWSDGTGYQMLLDADATAFGVEIPETGAMTSSGDVAADVIAAFEYTIPEGVDGTLSTTNIVLENSVTILIPAGTYDWCIINPTPGDRMWIASDAGNVGGRADDYEFKSGCAYEFTVYLGSDGHDATDVDIYDPDAPVVPEIAVTPAATSAYVDWEADANATGWNLRWRPWTDLSGNPHNWTFPAATYEEELADWWVYDADGDGQGWGLAYTDDEETDICLVSGSYTSSGACSPDNYIGTPDVPLKGELHFTMWGRSNSYPEVLQVYAMVGNDLYQLFEDSLISTTEHVVYTVDLSAFEGVEGSIVFRNYSTYDQWSIYIDDIFVGDPNAEIIEPAAWNYEYNITDDYFNIVGLTPGTKYEVQVQGYNADQTTDWCDIVEFTTLYNVYMLGGSDQGWDPTQGTPFTYDAENGVYTATITFPAEYNFFGFTTELAENNDDGGWAYIEPFRFGAIADEGTDYWYTGEEDYISLTWDAYHAIRIPAGEYKLAVDLNEMKLYIEKIGGEQPHGYELGDVNHDGDVSIGDVTALIDYLLGSGEVCEICADVNGDEQVSIGDVTALIDKLLGI